LFTAKVAVLSVFAAVVMDEPTCVQVDPWLVE